MFKSLKTKNIIIYLFFAIISSIVIIFSINSIYKLNRSIDTLMSNNYKSIMASSNMLEAIEEQNNSIYMYIYDNKDKSVDKFSYYNEMFNKWYSVESNNITESEEKDYVSKINTYYNTYFKSFYKLQDIKNSDGNVAALQYYNSTISSNFNTLKSKLFNLSQLNEKAMFKSRQNLISDINKYITAIISLTIIFVLGGFLISKYFTNKTLKTVNSLMQTIKNVDEKKLPSLTPIFSTDEIGQLATEFNTMTHKLHKFEESTIGQLLVEKNQSMTIVKSIPDPLIVLDKNHKILLINKACENIFFIDEEESLNKYFFDVINNSELYEFIRSSVNSCDFNSNKKVICINGNGSEYYFDVTTRCVRDTDNEIYGLVVVLQNITKDKELEKIKKDFVSIISHEFKTPLTSIIMGTTLLEDTNVGSINETQKQILNAIKEDSCKLNNLVTNLLNLSKIKSKEGIFNTQNCDINNLIESCIKNFANVCSKKDIKLVYEKNISLPCVALDFEKITWVLNNLISNSLKYIGNGDKVCVTSCLRENEILISVKDNGRGIPDNYVDKIFDKFIQVDYEDYANGGTGLGLPIAKEIVEAHGGHIWCQSIENKGSTFTFSLPFKN